MFQHGPRMTRDLKRKMTMLVAAPKASLNPSPIKDSHLSYVICSHSSGCDVKYTKLAALVCTGVPSLIIAHVRGTTGQTTSMSSTSVISIEFSQEVCVSVC